MEGRRNSRNARQAAERRARARRRRRNALILVALVSLAAGVAVGAEHGSGGGDGTGRAQTGGDGKAQKTAAAPAPGGLGAPPAQGRLVKAQGPVPVLMYHVIANAPSGVSLPELYVDPKTFDRQMEWLRGQGYVGVSLNQVYDAWFKDGELPEKPVVISFDDGYRGQYVFARRTLHRLGWPGILNLAIKNYTEAGAELTPAMVERMIDDGWELDSHTINHLDVSQLSGSQLREQVAGSRRILQRQFHQPVNFFCYPAGRYDSEAIAAVRSAGYLGATTTDEGLASKSEMLTLKRIRVDGSDGVAGLEQKLRLAGA